MPKQRQSDQAEPEKLREEMERLQARMTTMKIAYMNRMPFEDRVPTEEDVRTAAQSFIDVNHAYQRALYGRVRVKLSVANLLR